MKSFIGAALLTFGIALMTFSGSAFAQNVKGEHFLCYKVSAFGGFERRKVKLEDQFRGFDTVVLKPTLLCNPVSKNGERVMDRERHLVCYTIEPPRPEEVTVLVSNQLHDSLKLAVTEPAILCVPSLKKVLK